MAVISFQYLKETSVQEIQLCCEMLNGLKHLLMLLLSSPENVCEFLLWWLLECNGPFRFNFPIFHIINQFDISITYWLNQQKWGSFEKWKTNRIYTRNDDECRESTFLTKAIQIICFLLEQFFGTVPSKKVILVNTTDNDYRVFKGEIFEYTLEVQGPAATELSLWCSSISRIKERQHWIEQNRFQLG